MAGELDAIGVDAVVRARRVARAAELMEQARGKLSWVSIAWFACLAVAFVGYVFWAKLGGQVLVGLLLFFGIQNWFEARLSRRLDAIVRLLEQGVAK